MEPVKEEILVQDVHKMKNEMTTLKFQMGEIVAMKDQVRDILNAIKGSTLTGDGGMIARMIESEKDFVALELRVSTLEKKEDKQSFYLKVIWTLVGGAAVTAIQYILTVFVKH